MTEWEEARHVETLMKMSRRTQFIESSESDESVATALQLEAIRALKHERHVAINQSCIVHDIIKPIDDRRIYDRIYSLHQDGMLVARSLTIGFQKRYLRRQVGVCEVFPRWFALRSTICTWSDCRRIIDFLETQYGGSWEGDCRKFIADQPLPTENLSPQLQNMRSQDYMHVALYYTLKLNNKCHPDDLETCKACISDKFRTAVKD